VDNDPKNHKVAIKNPPSAYPQDTVELEDGTFFTFLNEHIPAVEEAELKIPVMKRKKLRYLSPLTIQKIQEDRKVLNDVEKLAAKYNTTEGFIRKFAPHPDDPPAREMRVPSNREIIQDIISAERQEVVDRFLKKYLRNIGQ
jgi:hypothetical protein